MIKICAVSGDTHQQVRIFFRMVVSIQQYFSVNDVGLELHTTFFEIRAEYAGEIPDTVRSLKQRGIDCESHRRAVRRVFFKIDTGHGIQR